MGLLKFLGNLFTGGNQSDSSLPVPNQNLPEVNQNALTPDSFTPNQEYLFTSSQLTREANNRGWVVDSELVKQSGDIAKNVKQNAKNVKQFGKNVKAISKGELSVSKDMSKIIQTVATNDAKKYGIVAQTQAGLNDSTVIYQQASAIYKQRLKETSQRINDAVSNAKQRRDKLKGK